MSSAIKTGLIVALGFCVLMSVAVTYYRYVIKEDFSYESKPLTEFTEDDL